MKEKLLKGLKWFYKSYIWLGIVLFGLDIFTKQLMMSLSNNQIGTIADWGIVRITYTLNEGAAFGMGTGDPVTNRVIYLIIASVISAGIAAYLIIKRKTTNLFVRASLIMVITGALGNVADGVFYGPLQGKSGLFTGRVVDWIDFYWVWDYVFNIADCCIVIAAFMLIFYAIVGEVKDYRARKKLEVKTVEATKKVLSKTEREIEEAKTNSEETSD